MFEDYARAIGNISLRLDELEKRLSVAESHIKILEVDRQIEVISPSWDEDDEDIVRCGECEYWTGYCTNKIWQSPTDDYLPQTYADDFCSYGERRSE